jgi:replicative DNA helicase
MIKVGDSMVNGNDDGQNDVDYSPHNIDAEQALLGTLLVNNETFDIVNAIVQSEHFF